MCRFVLYQGSPLTLAMLITEPANSLINQSVHSREQADPVNGDGFGVAWYVPEVDPEPALFRSVAPAWNNHNLLELARVTRSGCILAHVRRASPQSPVSELNCHPFRAGTYTFMHNGELNGFHGIRRQLLEGLSDEAFSLVRGNTDSEHIFALFLDHLRDALKASPLAPRNHSGNDRLHVEQMAAALEATIAGCLDLTRHVREPGQQTYLNIAISDGRCSAVSRFTTDTPSEALSLHLHTGKRYVCDGGVCRMVEPEERKGAVLISSEKLSHDPGWTSIPHNHLVVVRPDLSVEVRLIRVNPKT